MAEKSVLLDHVYGIGHEQERAKAKKDTNGLTSYDMEDFKALWKAYGGYEVTDQEAEQIAAEIISHLG